MRHIDADALAQDLIRRCFYPAIVKRAIEDAPTVNEWISVKERLPDRSGTYLVIGKSGTPHTAHFYADAPKFSNQYVRFWMPLPEAPVEVEK